MKFSNSCPLWDSIHRSTLAPEGIVCKRPRSRLEGWSVHALGLMQLSSTRATSQWERPRSLIIAFVHEGTMGTFSRCLKLSSTRALPRCERPRSVLTPVHHPSTRTWRSRNRWNPGSSGSCHQTSRTTCKFGRRGYDWADEAPGRRKSCSRASAMGSIGPRCATS